MGWTEKNYRWRVAVRGEYVYTTSPPRIAESLENLTTTAEFLLTASPPLGPVLVGDTVQMELIDLTTSTSWVMFRGYVDGFDVESQPHGVVVRCVGLLSKLRMTRRSADGDLLLSGMTDGQIVRALLDYCGVPYNPADIASTTFLFGQRQDLYWRVDEPASKIVQEIDDLLGMKTIDAGGRVFRIAYDLAPSVGLAYTTFRRGASTGLWRLHRAYGGMEQIKPVWRVTGVRATCGNCECTPWAAARDTAYVGSVAAETVASDLIQDESLARAVATRMMRWYNRYPDEIALEALTDPNVLPGQVIAIVDPAEYVEANLPGRAYTVVSVDREGSVMTLTAVGGPAGSTGTVTSGVEQVCNQTTSDTNWEDGYTDPGLGVPPLDLGDPFDGTFPSTGWEEEELPNTTDAFLGCTETDGVKGVADSNQVDDQGFVSWQYVQNTAWRLSNVAGVSAKVRADNSVEEILLHATTARDLWWNETPGYDSAKGFGNDNLLGTAPAFTISGEVMFRASGDALRIKLEGGDTALAECTLYATPGLSFNGHTWAVYADGENQVAKTSDSSPPGSCPHVSTDCNNGGYMGKDSGGFPLDTWIPFTISFDITSKENKIYVTAGSVSGYFEELKCWGPNCEFDFANVACSHVNHHVVVGQLSSAAGAWTASNPRMKLRLLGMGHTTCELNPNFIPPER